MSTTNIREAIALCERVKKRASGPSGRHLVPNRSVRIPSELWETFGDKAASSGSDRTTVINQLVADYCDRITR